MRLGVIIQPMPAAFYRALWPAKMMEARGHQVIGPRREDAVTPFEQLGGCDAVLVYRRSDERVRRLAARVARSGTRVVFDNDDDFQAMSGAHRRYRTINQGKDGGSFGAIVRMGRLAHLMTTTTEPLAERHRAAGVEPMAVIPNRLAPDAFGDRIPHDGVVIGWIAGGEHKTEIDRLPVRAALQRLLDRRHDVAVHSIGVDLRLRGAYLHEPFVDFYALGGRIAGWDLGLAPLTDTPFNRARSEIKLLEYGARGVPWLASPVGPYRGLGSEHGGWAVRDDHWDAALEEAVGDARLRARRGEAAQEWARSNTVVHTADQWERALFGSVPATSAGAGAAPR